MKTTRLLALSIAMFVVAQAAAAAEEPVVADEDSALKPEQTAGTETVTSQVEEKTMPDKMLIAYFSWSDGKNTRAAAETIQELTGGKIFQIKPVTPYSRDYDEVVAVGKKELADGTKPEIEPFSQDIAQYDVIFIGSPIWFGTYAPPVATFLTAHDLAGKRVVPFSTYGGGGSGRYASEVAKLCPQSDVLQEFSCAGKRVREAQEDIRKWLQSLNLAR